MSSLRSRSKVLIVAAVLLTALSCMKNYGSPTLRSKMRSIQGDVWSLYTYAWKPTEFYNDRNSKQIEQLLGRLADSFHNVQDLSFSESTEPGFAIALSTQGAVIAEAREAFASKDRSLANRKLRTLASNCIACHSRFKVEGNFFGSAPPIAASTLENQFAAAEYLFATRQFERANDELFRLGEMLKVEGIDSSYPFTALKLWLALHIRVKDTPGRALSMLNNFGIDSVDNAFIKEVLLSWVSDLQSLAEARHPKHALLVEAENLLGADLDSRTLEDDIKSLVPTLRATAVLHNLLRGQLPKKDKKKCMLLLARAYHHLPIESLAGNHERYLEELIVRYPGTKEAQVAYDLYQRDLAQIYGKDSRGVAIVPQEKKARLAELKELANRDVTLN